MRAEGPKKRTSAVYPNINRAPARTKSRRQLAVRLQYLEVFAGGAVCFDNSLCGSCIYAPSGLRPSCAPDVILAIYF